MKSVLQYVDSDVELSCFIVVLSVGCSIPVSLLLVSILNCPVHVNCRFLIFSWGLSLQGYLINVFCIHAQNLLPESFSYFSNTRSYLLFANAILHMCCTCFEMKIALERIISTRKPHVYHDSTFSYLWNVPCIFLPFITGSLIGCAAYFRDEPLTLLFPNVVDFSTVLVRESVRVARIMQPVYIVSFLLKISAFTISNANVPLMLEPEMYCKLSAAYFIIHCFNCAISSIFFIVHCDFVKNAIFLLFGMERIDKTSQVGIALSHQHTTKTYFNMLESSWN